MLSRLFQIGVCIALLGGLVSALSANSVPASITYQGKLTNSSGVPVPDIDHTLVFRIYAFENGGLPLWTSSPMIVKPANGLFTVVLGPINPGDLGPADAWVEVSVNGTALPRTRLTSAPYALRAADLRLPLARSYSDTGHLIDLVNPIGGVLRAVGNGGRDTLSISYSDPFGAYSALYATSQSNTGAAVNVIQYGRAGVAIFDSYSSSATAPAVAMYTTSSQPSLYAYSYIRNSSVYLTESTAALRAVQGTSSHAGYFDGFVRTTGNLQVDNGRVLNSNNERLTPIAYGFINSNGTTVPGSSSSNVSSSWNSSLSRYEITISGYSYFFSSFVTVVTPSANTPVIATTGSVSGNLLVHLHNLSGNKVQGDFQFVTYRK